MWAAARLLAAGTIKKAILYDFFSATLPDLWRTQRFKSFFLVQRFSKLRSWPTKVFFQILIYLLIIYSRRRVSRIILLTIFFVVTHTGRPQLVMQNFVNWLSAENEEVPQSAAAISEAKEADSMKYYYIYILSCVCICTLHWKEPRCIACDGNRSSYIQRSKCTNRLGNYKKPLLCGARRKTNLWSKLRKVGSENRKIIVQIDVVCMCVMLKGRALSLDIL